MRIALLSITALLALVIGIAPSAYAAGNADDGKKVFNNKKLGQCSVCHNITAKKKVGPGLKGISKIHGDDWMKKWLKDPQKTWKENDAETAEMKKRLKRAKKKKTKMKLKYGKKFTDQNIEDLVAYMGTL